MTRRRRAPRPGALADLAPFRILTQICLLQVSYYGAAVVLIVFTTLVAGQHPNPGDVFDWRTVRGDVTSGWTLGLCWMLDALITYAFCNNHSRGATKIRWLTTLISVIPILLLIARSKLVPDFALTIHFIHLMITSIYVRSLPNTVSWWALQVFSAALMTFLGIWACQWRELRPMAFGGKSKERQDPAPALNDGQPSQTDDEAGFIMGSGHGRGRDGAGTYEMVNMAKEPA